MFRAVLSRSFLFLLLASPVTVALAQAVTFSGIVTDEATDLGIPGAAVYLPDLHRGAVTDDDGRFTITGLPGERTLVKVSMTGYAAMVRVVDLSAASTHEFKLSTTITEMQDVVVTGTTKAKELRRDPVPTTLAGREFLRENPSANIISSLEKLPGISVAGTGPNIAKPYIRGLGAGRVLTLYDGIRQESQQWGEEHGVEIDQFLVDRVEVVKGPASLMYGSDALAGVVNLIPAPSVAPGITSGSITGRVASNNRELAGSANIDGNTGRFIYGARLSGNMAGNYRNRYDGPVYGTKFREQAAAAYAGVNRPWGFTHVHFSLYDNLQEVPDGSRDSTTRRFTWRNSDADSLRPIASDGLLNSYRIGEVHQHIRFLRAHANSSFRMGGGRLAAKLAFTRSVRQEYEHPEHPAMAAVDLRLNSFIYDLKYHLPERNGWELSAGVNGMQQRNDASHGTELLVPDHGLVDLGPFVHAAKSWGRFELSGGARLDRRWYQGEAMYTRIDPATGFEHVVDGPGADSTVEKHFDALDRRFTGTSASIGAAWIIHERFTLKANLGRGYRAPGAAELSADGFHHGSGILQLGSADLRPETNLQQDLGLFYSGTHVTASVELFNNLVDHFIYNERMPAVGGGDSLATHGVEEFPVYSFRQTKARLLGGEVTLDIHPHPLDRLHFESTLSMVIGTNEGGGGVSITDSTRHLPMIPPLRLNSEMRYDVGKVLGGSVDLFVKAGVRVHAAQRRFFGAYGTETATPGYTLVDAGLGADLLRRNGRTVLTMTIMGTNLADIGYQDHMSRLKYFEDYPVNGTGRSGIYGMGRNITVQVMVPFRIRKKEAATER